MDIAGLSTTLAQTRLQNDFSVKMLDKSLEANEQMGASMIQMMDRSMELSVNPNVGSNFDMTV